MSMLEDLGKNLPVKDIYEDLAQPAIRETGAALGSVAKVARFALAPIDYLASFQDRWQRYLKRLSEKVPEERLLEPDPQVAGRIIEGLRYADEDGIIAEMFLNLLARALDKNRVGEAHPAFPLIVNQLSPDEALFLFLVKDYLIKRTERVVTDVSSTVGDIQSSGSYAVPPNTPFSFPGHLDIYYNHLHSLNLIKGEIISEPTEHFSERSGRQITTVNSMVCFTPFGKLFARACIPNEMPPFER